MRDPHFFAIIEKYKPTFESQEVTFGVYPNLRKVVTNASERNYIGLHSGDPHADAVNSERNSIWLAGSLLHECFQGNMYWDYQRAHPGDAVPDDVWRGAAAENRSLVVQAAALRAMGAPKEVVNFVTNEIDPTNSPDSYWNRYKDGQIQP